MTLALAYTLLALLTSIVRVHSLWFGDRKQKERLTLMFRVN